MLKPKWQVIESVSLRSIHANLFKSVEGTFHEILRNCMDTVLTKEYVPSKALTEMLLLSMSSATNLISMEESLSL